MTIQLNVGANSVELVGNSVTYDASRVADELEGRGVTDIDGLTTVTATSGTSDVGLAKVNSTWRLLTLDAMLNTVDDDAGASNSGSTGANSILGAAIVNPIPRIWDAFVFRAAGSCANVTGGGPYNMKLTCAFAGNNLWTPFDFSVPNGQGVNWEITSFLSFEASVSSSVAIIVRTKLETNAVGATLETVDTSLWRRHVINPTINATTTNNWTLTATHNNNGALLVTTCTEAHLFRYRRSF